MTESTKRQKEANEEKSPEDVQLSCDHVEPAAERKEAEPTLGNLPERVPTVVHTSRRELPGLGSLKVSVRGLLHSSPVQTGRADVAAVREPLVDLFDEESCVVVIAEVPGAELSDVRLELCEDILVLNVQTAECTFQQEILLPSPVSLDGCIETLHNGVLELKLRKTDSGFRG
ncbi:MAG: Hsp20/alpha crystallin family protein [Blastocatellia bacterium]|nr:Hsp20/alpha crystallin family protein [Blastocatellia bacterium]